MNVVSKGDALVVLGATPERAAGWDCPSLGNC